jgi:uncharacterized RDD family membrane protein YckC
MDASDTPPPGDPLAEGDRAGSATQGGARPTGSPDPAGPSGPSDPSRAAGGAPPGPGGYGVPGYGGPPMPPQAGPAPGLLYGSAGVRLVAWIIDAIIIGAIDGAFGAVLGLGFVGWGGLRFGGTGPFPFLNGIGVGWLIWVAVVTVISGVYFVGLWTRNGGTLGQLLLSLEVRNAVDGSRLTQDQAIRRWAFLVVPVISALPGLGFFVFLYQLYLLYTTANDPAKQGFHDKQAGTVVVRRVS